MCLIGEAGQFAARWIHFDCDATDDLARYRLRYLSGLWEPTGGNLRIHHRAVHFHFEHAAAGLHQLRLRTEVPL